MNDKQQRPGSKDPGQTYRDEMNDRGHAIFDNEEQGDARDRAKMDKSLQGHGQKMDSAHPDDLQPDQNDINIEKERDDF